MVTLSKSQAAQATQDLNEKCPMLTDPEIHGIAIKANLKFPFPILSEESSLSLYFKIIKLIDDILYDNLPNEYYSLIHDASNGISPEEAEVLKEKLLLIILGLLKNIPLISDKLKREIVEFILGIIIDALIKGSKLEEAPLG